MKKTLSGCGVRGPRRPKAGVSRERRTAVMENDR
ncbi:hypothetical protein SLEP1_g47955 [Rubroshorea leprosula]|uniref:Uncharacterized protein n=1 Tax=Rubroshorea leprosula TaxID=152421 RepID=A0AAV5LSZ3_9ROSI|nr:hypothetical protein SLEP1_g47955 [Rubroshorea leprosula]